MIATVVILGILVVLLAARVGGLVEESKDMRERLAHLEGHVCGEPDDPDGDEDDVDDEAGDDEEAPAAARQPEPAPSPLGLKAN